MEFFFPLLHSFGFEGGIFKCTRTGGCFEHPMWDGRRGRMGKNERRISMIKYDILTPFVVFPLRRNRRKGKQNPVQIVIFI